MKLKTLITHPMKKKKKEQIEDNVTWSKCSEVETFEEKDQQVFKIKEKIFWL